MATKKILYIDDDPLNRSLVNRLLTSYDFEVLEADTGLQGISMAQSEKPALILMDINMPGLDGHETTTRMRSIPALAQTPIVALTARTTKGEKQLAITAGCDGYIPKPIDVDTFPQQIISYLEGRRDTITGDERQRYLGEYNQKLVERLEGKVLELQEANTKLQKIDKLKSDFITLAAHELRTPITLVYGYARLLQNTTRQVLQEKGEDNIHQLANNIFDSVYRLNEVVNDILNIALLEADEMRLVFEEVNLPEIITAALEGLDPQKNGRALEIQMEEMAELPVIVADPERLQQAFWNILSNAIKFTPDGGSITIQGRLVESSEKGEGGVLISVIDTGIGIPAADQEEIFERFYVVGNISYHSSSKTAYQGGGLGLGLPIARGIIQAHGGQIWIKSRGQNTETLPGSACYVFLPFDATA